MVLAGIMMMPGMGDEVSAQTVQPVEADSTGLLWADDPFVVDSMEVAMDTTTVMPDTLRIDSLTVPMPKPVKTDGRGTSHFMPNPIRAMWLGLVFPGGGQIYNRKYWKLPVFYGGFLGCMYALTWNSMMYRDYSQAYLDIMDDDPNTKSYEAMLPPNYSIEGREKRFQEIFRGRKDRYRKWRDLSIFAFIGVYALSIVDAYVDAELSSFDISPNLSMNLQPTIISTNAFGTTGRFGQQSYGLQCNLNF